MVQRVNNYMINVKDFYSKQHIKINVCIVPYFSYTGHFFVNYEHTQCKSFNIQLKHTKKRINSLHVRDGNYLSKMATINKLMSEQ